jgi:hypothetical protein
MALKELEEVRVRVGKVARWENKEGEEGRDARWRCARKLLGSRQKCKETDRRERHKRNQQTLLRRAQLWWAAVTRQTTVKTR